jgi:hypothetical protein
MKNKNVDKRFDEKITMKIEGALFRAWEAGKKQKETPLKYTLDTDKLGRPIYNLFKSFLHQELDRARKEERKRIREEFIKEYNSRTSTTKFISKFLDLLDKKE